MTRFDLPRIPWPEIKNKILSDKYDLSLVFVADKEMARLNSKYRAESRPTNVLAFPLAKNLGEIFIDLPRALGEARTFKKKPKEHLLFLYIHALLHLKGLRHHTPKLLKIMRKTEQKWLKTLS